MTACCEQVMYLDTDVRIFRSGGSYAVQVKTDVLQAAAE